jgi:hypothetical protein
MKMAVKRDAYRHDLRKGNPPIFRPLKNGRITFLNGLLPLRVFLTGIESVPEKSEICFPVSEVLQESKVAVGYAKPFEKIAPYLDITFAA